MLLGLFFACSTPAHAPAPAAAPQVVVETPALKTLPADKAFPCCDTPEAQSAVSAYVKLDDRLAADDAVGADLAVVALGNALATELPDVSAKLLALKGTTIDAKRDALKTLSKDLVAYTRKHKGGDGAIAEAYCPMADASWIQAAPELRNPYYGAKMLTCGSFR